MFSYMFMLIKEPKLKLNYTGSLNVSSQPGLDPLSSYKLRLADCQQLVSLTILFEVYDHDCLKFSLLLQKVGVFEISSTFIFSIHRQYMNW